SIGRRQNNTKNCSVVRQVYLYPQKSTPKSNLLKTLRKKGGEGGTPPLPIGQSPVQFPGDRQVRPLVRMLGRQRLIDFHTQPRLVPWMHVPRLEPVRMRKHLVGQLRVVHVLLDSEVMNG